MGIRRRRRRLSSLLTRLDDRVRSVELRPVSLLSSSEVENLVSLGEAIAQPTNLVSGTAPNEFRKIQDAYIYPKARTGSEDRVAIYLESDLQLTVGDTLEVSGIHGTSTFDLDTSGEFELKFTDPAPFDDDNRASWKHDPTQDQLPGVTISNEYSYKPDTQAPTAWGKDVKRLQTKRLVDEYSITDAEVTLTMNAVHKFKVDDAIFVDIFEEDSRAYGVDGLFRVTAVTDNTITYTLTAGVDTPTGDVIPTGDVYVFPVARNYVPVGSTWSNSSNNKIYVWDGLRWVDYSTAEVGQDGDPPAAPTNLTVDDQAAVGNASTGYRSYSEVTLSWTPPTLTAAGEELTDLLGYRISWRKSTLEDWKDKKIDDLNLSSYTLGDDVLLQQDQFYYFKVEAYDSGLQYSDPVTATHTTSVKTGDISIYPPTNPTATTRLGTVKVSWDGRLQSGFNTTIAAPDDTAKMRVYLSIDNINFEPEAEATYFENSTSNFVVLADLNYGTTYYIKITAINTSGVESPFSGTVAVQPEALVDADAIASTLTAWPFDGQVIPANSLADGSINASSLFGQDVVVQSAIAANAIGANQLAANSVIAGKIGVNAVTANTIAALSISANKIQSNAVEADKIKAGAITAIKIDADAVTADKIKAGAVTANAIAAGTITADKLISDFVLSDLIIVGEPGSSTGSTSGPGRIEIRGNNSSNPGIVAFENTGAGATNATFRLYTGNGRAYLKETFIDGPMTIESGGSLTVNGSVSGGTFTGGTFQTSSSGQRVVIRGDTDSVQFRDSSGNLRGEIEGITTGLVLDSGALNGRIIVGGGVQLNDSNGTIASFTNSGQILSAVGSSTLSANMRHRGQTLSIAVTSSDSRLKDSIAQISNGLSLVSQLNPVTFNSKVDETDKIVSGFLAQDVANVLPVSEYTVVEEIENTIPDVEGVETMGFDENPMLSINHVELIPYLTKAIQELSEKNAELEARLEALEGN